MVDTTGGDSHPTTLGAYVRRERERAGLSQRQLATRVGMHHSRIARLESGEVTSEHVRPEYVQGLANALNVDVSKLLHYLGITPKPDLPSVRTYFRRKLGVNADEAEVLANLVADYRQSIQRTKSTNTKGGMA